MKRLLLAASLALLSLSSPAAFAHDDDYDRDRHGHHHDRDYDDDDRRHRHHGRKHKGWKRDHYRRGERIEIVHVERRYYVDDYEHYHLRQPPRGHRWIRTEDGRYLLVAVATGIIADRAEKERLRVQGSEVRRDIAGATQHSPLVRHAENGDRGLG